MVDELERAIHAQLNSRSGRRKAHAGIETALADGLDVIRNLGVIVANVLRDDPTGLAGWQGARRIEGLTRGVARPVTVPVPPDAEPSCWIVASRVDVVTDTRSDRIRSKDSHGNESRVRDTEH